MALGTQVTAFPSKKRRKPGVRFTIRSNQFARGMAARGQRPNHQLYRMIESGAMPAQNRISSTSMRSAGTASPIVSSTFGITSMIDLEVSNSLAGDRGRAKEVAMIFGRCDKTLCVR